MASWQDGGGGRVVLVGSPSPRAAFLPGALALPASVYSPRHIQPEAP